MSGAAGGGGVSLSWVHRCYLPSCIRGIFSPLTRKLFLTALLQCYLQWWRWGVIHTSTFLSDQTRARLWNNSFPFFPGINTNKIRSESILPGGRSCPFPKGAGGGTACFPGRQAQAPCAAPKGTRGGAGAPQTPRGQRPAPGTAAPQPCGRLRRSIRHPDRGVLSPAPFPGDSVLVRASPASGRALMPGPGGFRYLG